MRDVCCCLGSLLMKSSETRGKGHLGSDKGAQCEKAPSAADCTISADVTQSALTEVNENVQKAAVFGQRDNC